MQTYHFAIMRSHGKLYMHRTRGKLYIITHRTAPHQLLIAEARVYHPSWQIQRTWREARGAVATPTLPVDTSVHAPAPVPIPVRYGRWRAAQPHGCTTVASSSSVGARSVDAGAPAVTREA